MSTDLARVEPAPSSALVTREYLNAKRDLVRSLYAPKTNDLEFEHFLEVCATRGLNPLAKQIYCVSRKQQVDGQWVEVPTIQTSIDGYRLIAQRTGEYRGQVGPHWCGADGQWVEVWLASEPPAAARVGVLREGFSEPLFGVARWSSYVQTTKSGDPTKFWKQMPDVMLAKVAESLALRKAFPEELSGLYTDDEMAQAGERSPSGETVWAARWRELQALAAQAGVSEDELKANLKSLGLSSAKGLADEDAYDAAVRLITGEADPAGDEPVEGEVVPPDGDEEPPVISEDQRRRMLALGSDAGLSKDDVKDVVAQMTGADSTTRVPLDRYDDVCAYLEGLAAQRTGRAADPDMGGAS